MATVEISAMKRQKQIPCGDDNQKCNGNGNGNYNGRSRSSACGEG